VLLLVLQSKLFRATIVDQLDFGSFRAGLYVIIIVSFMTQRKRMSVIAYRAEEPGCMYSTGPHAAAL